MILAVGRSLLMAIRWRPMRPRDVVECVQIVATHSIQAPRYGRAIHNLRTFWEGLLGREAFRAIVFERMQNESRVRIIGVGVSVFISDAFLNFIKTPPYFWVYEMGSDRQVSDRFRQADS